MQYILKDKKLINNEIKYWVRIIDNSNYSDVIYTENEYKNIVHLISF